MFQTCAHAVQSNAGVGGNAVIEIGRRINIAGVQRFVGMAI